MNGWSRARALAGVLCKDWWRYERALRSSRPAYLALCNRTERLEPAPDGSGWRCDRRWTSDLHAPQYLPALGRRLMRRALFDHPIGRATVLSAGSGTPQVSFVIGHRGKARLPHLLSTLSSIAAQRDPRLECLVIEQETESVLGPLLPSWVRHVHTPPPDAAMPYSRSWAFNVGARHARGRVLVLHDNDLLVPQDYVSCLLSRFDEGYAVVNLKRFIFYLDPAHTAQVMDRRASIVDMAPDAITQNTEGGSIAITQAGFDSIGGMDESFVGWGGEDNEFWGRAQTLRAWTWGYLPLVHLWHAPQAGKRDAQHETLRHFRTLAQIDPTERIDLLKSVRNRNASGPANLPPIPRRNP